VSDDLGANGQPLALTRSQMAIWTGQRLQPDEPLYNMVLVFRIDAALDPEIFRAAFRALIRNCDVLRTVFTQLGDEPRQRVLPELAYELEIVDVSTDPDPEARFAAWIDERKVQLFDLAERQFDSALIKLSARSFAWYLNQHHLLTDAWSVSLLYRKLRELYSLARQGRLEEASALPRYCDYAAREFSRRDRPQRRNAEAWWQAKLAGKPAPSTFYRPAPPARTGRTVRVPCPLGLDRSRRLRALAESEAFQSFTVDLSLFRIIATVLCAYLHRLSGNREIVIGTPSHGRSSAIQKKTPGLFIELFPLQAQIDERESFLGLHRKISDEMQAFLLNAVPGSSSLEQNRAYDVILNYITASFGDFDGAPMHSEWVHVDHSDRNHLLRLQVQDFDRAEELTLYFDLNVACFVGEERRWVASHFLKLLDAFLADPDREIAAVDLLSTEERKTLTEVYNDTTVNPPPEETVVGLFELQATAAPDRVALVCGDRRLTYRDLDRRANRLARALAARGLGPGARVAVCMERSTEAVVALLGIMKSGAAYLPIDPETPKARFALLLKTAEATLVLTEEGLAKQIPSDAAAVSTLDTLLSEAPAGPDDAAPTRAGLDNVAYVLHTSGSTGGPKGVIVGHRGLANYLSWAKHYYLRGEVLDFPLFTALTFDLTVTSLFVPLISGGRVVIYRGRAGSRDIPILEVIEDNQVDVVKLTPAHLSLIQGMDLAASRIKKLIVGGENFRTDLGLAILKRFGRQVEIYNEYGPTEGTVACMIHNYDPGEDTEASIPIGRAIDNLEVYVLDEHHHPVPQGVTGEIYIGGLGVAKGYLGDPAETARRFVDSPSGSGETLYRTGDLAKWNPSGTMTYLGREDFQIKLRGVRIEPGEIESALLEHDEISACAVDLLKRSESPSAAAQTPSSCLRCGLPATHPDAKLDGETVCAICRDFETKQDLAQAYFETMDDLRAIASGIKNRALGTADCMILLSGGKDSTYALCQLVDLGLTPLIFTLDNGFISEGAKANIRRVADQFGLEVVVGATPAMNTIFLDSLNRFSDVCNGCFKTIYSLSTKLARERGLTTIFTGLSRGQIFETRLADLFKQGIVEPDQIDRTIIEARKAYHRMDDAVARSLDVSLFQDDAVFEEIRFVDFYRYSDAMLDEILGYLATHVPWIRPADSGRSTNCLINNLGIHVHKTERGYHNYAAPYSWDVRLGHKMRDAAMAELDDEINLDKVNRMLDDIGYQIETPQINESRLVAYYVAPHDIPADELRRDLAQRLPAAFLPNDFVRLDHLPLTPNDKIDRAALPRPDMARPALGKAYVAPTTEVESQLATIWREVLELDNVGIDDNFFDLGGDSILNIRIVARAKKLNLTLTPQQIFDFPTIAAQAPLVTRGQARNAEQGDVTGDLPLTPIQCRYFAEGRSSADPFSQTVVLEIAEALDPERLEQALNVLQRHHDGLRTRFTLEGDRWRQRIERPEYRHIPVERIELAAGSPEEQDAAIDSLEVELAGRLNGLNGDLVRVALVTRGGDKPSLLVMAIHHLVVDGVSWWILLEDLETVYAQLTGGEEPRLGDKSSSMKAWSNALAEVAASGRLQSELDFWTQLAGIDGTMPRDRRDGSPNNLADARSVTMILDEEETAHLVHQAAASYGVQVPDLLMTSLVQTLGPWAGHDTVRFDVEGHGREEIVEDIDLSRTIGWFTTIYPMALALPPDSDPRAAVASAKEQIAAVPNRGIGYGIQRYLESEQIRNDRVAEEPPADILFNYLGRWDQALKGSGRFRLDRPISVYRGTDGVRTHAIEVVALVFDRRLRIDWVYSMALHDRATIERLAAQFKAHLHAILTGCHNDRGGTRSTAEFPLADLTQEALEDLLEEFAEPVGEGG